MSDVNRAEPEHMQESLKPRLKEETVDGKQKKDDRGLFIAAKWCVNASIWRPHVLLDFSTSGESQDCFFFLKEVAAPSSLAAESSSSSQNNRLDIRGGV